MDADTIERFLHLLGVGDTKWRGTVISAPCPLAMYRHAKGLDRHPSFAVTVCPGGQSRANCLACGWRGDLLQLVWCLESHRGPGKWINAVAPLVLADARSLAQLEELMAFAQGTDGPSHNKFVAGSAITSWYSEAQAAQPDPLDSLAYDVLPELDATAFLALSHEARSYLLGPRRRLTQTTVELWGLGWHPDKRRVVIPVRDLDGGLVCLTGRCLDLYDEVTGTWEHEQEPKFLHSKGFRRDFFLFGEHLVQGPRDTGYLVEGHFDAMYLRQCGFPNTLAVMGSHLSRVQVLKLKKLLSEVVIVPDGDKPGGEAALRWEAALRAEGVRVSVADVVEGKDPDDYEIEQLDELLAVEAQHWA